MSQTLGKTSTHCLSHAGDEEEQFVEEGIWQQSEEKDNGFSIIA